jgi:hypothetical protein
VRKRASTSLRSAKRIYVEKRRLQHLNPERKGKGRCHELSQYYNSGNKNLRLIDSSTHNSKYVHFITGLAPIISSKKPIWTNNYVLPRSKRSMGGCDYYKCGPATIRPCRWGRAYFLHSHHEPHAPISWEFGVWLMRSRFCTIWSWNLQVQIFQLAIAVVG